MLCISGSYGAVQQSDRDAAVALERVFELRDKTLVPISVNIVPLSTLGSNHWITKRSTDEFSSRRRKRKRRRNDDGSADGLLKAKQIKAKQLKAGTLNARRVKADRIKGDTIISDTIVVTARRRRPQPRVESRSFEEQPAERRPKALIQPDKQPVRINIHLPAEDKDPNSLQNRRPPFEINDRRRGGLGDIQSPRYSIIDKLMSPNENNAVRNLDTLQANPQGLLRSRKRKSRRKQDNIGFREAVAPVAMRDRSMLDARDLSLQPLESQSMHEQQPSELGLLQANEISAGDIRTRSMNADTITADQIQSQRVNSKHLRVNEGGAAKMAFFVYPKNSASNINDAFDNRVPSRRNTQMTDLTGSGSVVSGLAEPTRPRYRTVDNLQSAVDNYPFESQLYRGRDRSAQMTRDAMPTQGLLSRVRLDRFSNSKSKQHEIPPNLEMLGISTLTTPERKMYVEQPVIKQPLKYRFESKSRYVPSEPAPQSIAIEENFVRGPPSMFDRVDPSVGNTEYVSDTYKSFGTSKSINTINEPFMF